MSWGHVAPYYGGRERVSRPGGVEASLATQMGAEVAHPMWRGPMSMWKVS